MSLIRSDCFRDSTSILDASVAKQAHMGAVEFLWFLTYSAILRRPFSESKGTSQRGHRRQMRRISELNFARALACRIIEQDRITIRFPNGG